MAEFYSARGWEIPPLPWTNLSPPFSNWSSHGYVAEGIGKRGDGGLEDWWKTLPDEPRKRRSLRFRIWAAVAELTSDETWWNLNVRCVRSVTGEWFAVDGMAFLNEALPAEDEPGGSEARKMMQPFIPDANRLDAGWVAALRQLRQQAQELEMMSQVWGWIENNARSISLEEIVRSVLDALVSSTIPDWSVLVPFGHWAKHRDRADLLTHVLVQPTGHQLGIRVGDALVADPYVEQGQDRRRLFPEVPVIAGVYMETDPKGAGAHEWRTFFERAGAKGSVEVRTSRSTVNRWESEKVAAFLGHDTSVIPESNNKGYTLLDLDIVPSLPGGGASIELRAALTSWLEDGLSRHSPYTIQIRGIRTTFPPPRELYPLCSHPMA